MSHGFDECTHYINTKHFTWQNIENRSTRANIADLEMVQHFTNEIYGIWTLINIKDDINKHLMLVNLLRKSADHKQRANKKQKLHGAL
jgi:hypothetical protein